MSNVTVGKILNIKGKEGNRTLQACEIGGSIYGRASRGAVSAKPGQEAKNDLASNYKNFYRNQVDMMSKVFGKNTK